MSHYKSQYLFNPINYHFSWTEDWYEFNQKLAQKQALKERNQKAKELRKLGYKVSCFTLPNQLITRGGIGSGHPQVDFFVNCYGLNIVQYPLKY